jgi:hypothetical protein
MDASRWVTAITDSTGDSLLRGLEGSGDLAAVKAELETDRLRLRVSTRLPLSPRMTYTIRLHAIGHGAARAEPVVIPFHRLQCDKEGVNGECSVNELEADLPLKSLGQPAAVMVGADSRMGRVAIDRVCWRLLRLNPVSVSSPLPARSLRQAARRPTPLIRLR